MPFEPGSICNCGEHWDEHCETCESCPNEPVQECCMEGWSEEAKQYQREYEARKK